MKKLDFFMILPVLLFFVVSCAEDEEDTGDTSANVTACESNFDCPTGLYCDLVRKVCTDGSDTGDSGNDSDTSADSDSGDTLPDGENQDNGDTVPDSDNNNNNNPPSQLCTMETPCTPGTTCGCGYQADPATENVGECKRGFSTCQDDGTWGKCQGEVLPVTEFGELCSNGKDDDCDGTVDNGTDFDGDGYGICIDCCEDTDTCPNPAEAWDKDDPYQACKYEKITYECDSEIAANSTDPEDYAKAIGICQKTTENSDKWGLISAQILTPTGNSANVHAGSNGLLSKLGDVIKPKEGGFMLGLSSGLVRDPFERYSSGPISGAPGDWVAANGGHFPSAASCSTSGTDGGVYDAVMLQLKIKTPATAKSFSFNIYFLTDEYPTWICTQYNDFFVALLDSSYTSSDPDLRNPFDKNLAMDASGNPVGVNLAPAGLFTQCVNAESKGVTSCVGTEDLKNTGFADHGGTGWLTTRGNIVGGEIITLRLAIWDLNDHQLDSLVLIDNFRWDVSEQKPGTSM